MDRPRRALGLLAGTLLWSGALASLVLADGPVGTSFPADFPVIEDASLGTPVLGFGASGPVARTPVLLLHGNNDTPFPTTCNGAYGHIIDLAEHLHVHGYARSELWALGYQGDQCDIVADPTIKSGESHSTVANVADLRAFVAAVRDYTGAAQVDIVGHSLGGTLAREWMRQDDAYDVVRRLVTIDSPHHGIINCSPSPLNYFALPPAGGFDPDSAICVEYGAPDTPFLTALNADPTPGPTEYLAIRNADVSFVYIPERDGVFPPVPAEDRQGRPHDFSASAALAGARVEDLTGQGAYDTTGTAHIGISNSPEAWTLVLDFLTAPPASDAGDPTGPVPPAPQDPAAPPRAELPVTGAGGWLGLAGLAGVLVGARRHR